MSRAKCAHPAYDVLVHNHLISNHALHECQMPFFQRKIAIPSEGFLCQRWIDPGDCLEIVIGNLDSKILSLDSSCPPMPAELRRRHADNKTSDCLALALSAFHCLGGRPPGRIYESRLRPRIKKISWSVCCIQGTENACVSTFVPIRVFIDASISLQATLPTLLRCFVIEGNDDLQVGWGYLLL